MRIDVFVCLGWQEELSQNHFSLKCEANSDTCDFNEGSSRSCKILTPVIVKPYLHTGETLPHRSTPSCIVLAHVRTLAQVITSSYLGWPM